MAARLSFDERCVISAMVGVGASARQIADELGRHSSTVRREINRAGGRGVYRLYASKWGERVLMRGGGGRVAGQLMPPVWSSTRSRCSYVLQIGVWG